MKIESILFWILVMMSILIILWLFRGSPGPIEAAFTLIIFCMTQIVLIWKEFYSFKQETKTKLNKIDGKLDLILRR